MNDRMKRAIAKIEGDNAKAKKRREAAKLAHDEWSKGRVADPMIPYRRDGDVDSRGVVDEGPPVRRAYLHTYGWPREDRRRAIAVHKRVRRRARREQMKPLFRQIWESQRFHNAAA